MKSLCTSGRALSQPIAFRSIPKEQALCHDAEVPVIKSEYSARLFFRNGHFQTVYPVLFRRENAAIYQRERIETPDGDFLDLDWSRNRSLFAAKKLVIISHGMEGSSYSSYVLGIVSRFTMLGWSALAWNFRGCSGVPNLKLRSYHGGASDDLETVVKHAIAAGYSEIALIGFSMGGNITLKYLGERGADAPQEIKRAVTVAVPCDLQSAVISMAKRSNRIYMRRFLRLLKRKMKQKARLFPGEISLKNYRRIKSFKDFDRIYTAPINSFESAEDYWNQSSSIRFLHNIRVPSLLINAQDDPFLGDGCFPFKEAEENPFFYFEAPKHGGHVGFFPAERGGMYWYEKRAVEFILRKSEQYEPLDCARQRAASSINVGAA